MRPETTYEKRKYRWMSTEIFNSGFNHFYDTIFILEPFLLIGFLFTNITITYIYSTNISKSFIKYSKVLRERNIFQV